MNDVRLVTDLMGLCGPMWLKVSHLWTGQNVHHTQDPRSRGNVMEANPTVPARTSAQKLVVTSFKLKSSRKGRFNGQAKAGVKLYQFAR